MNHPKDLQCSHLSGLGLCNANRVLEKACAARNSGCSSHNLFKRHLPGMLMLLEIRATKLWTAKQLQSVFSQCSIQSCDLRLMIVALLCCRPEKGHSGLLCHLVRHHVERGFDPAGKDPGLATRYSLSLAVRSAEPDGELKVLMSRGLHQ